MQDANAAKREDEFIAKQQDWNKLALSYYNASINLLEIYQEREEFVVVDEKRFFDTEVEYESNSSSVTRRGPCDYADSADREYECNLVSTVKHDEPKPQKAEMIQDNDRSTSHKIALPFIIKSPSKKSVLCAVCGALASGFQYGAYCCEACARFFRKPPYQLQKHKCMNGGKCTVAKARPDELVKKQYYCQACRLKKCLDVGMRRENYRNKDKVGRAVLTNHRTWSAGSYHYTRAKSKGQQISNKSDEHEQEMMPIVL